MFSAHMSLFQFDTERDATCCLLRACCCGCRELCAAAGSGPGLADMFGRIMVSVDEDIISLEIPRCAETYDVDIHEPWTLTVPGWHGTLSMLCEQGCWGSLPVPLLATRTHWFHYCRVQQEVCTVVCKSRTAGWLLL